MFANRYSITAKSNLSRSISVDSFNDAIIQSLCEFSNASILTLDHDYELITAAKKSSKVSLKNGAHKVCAKQLNDVDVVPSFTTRGLQRVISSDSTFHIEFLTKSTASTSFKLKDNCLVPSAGAMADISCVAFKGTLRDKPVFGYVSIDEVKGLLPDSMWSKHALVDSVMYETAIYRALQRLDVDLLSQEMQALISLHELRNFLTFNNHAFDENIFSEILSVVKSREDYLLSLSVLWKENSASESTYLAYALTRYGIEHGLSLDRLKMEAYQLAEEAAISQHSLSPINGGIYVTCFEQDAGGFAIGLRETVQGKVARCFAKAGLESIFAECIYEDDEFYERDNDVVITTKSINSMTRTADKVTGAFAVLSFIDGTSSKVVIHREDLLEAATASTSSAWQRYFARMAIKTAIGQAIDRCDWSVKYPNNLTRYLQ